MLSYGNFNIDVFLFYLEASKHLFVFLQTATSYIALKIFSKKVFIALLIQIILS